MMHSVKDGKLHRREGAIGMARRPQQSILRQVWSYWLGRPHSMLRPGILELAYVSIQEELPQAIFVYHSLEKTYKHLRPSGI